MGLLWLTALSIGFVIAAAPPQAISARVRVGAVIALASFGLGAQAAQAGNIDSASVGAQVTFSAVVTLLALSIPVAMLVARQRR